MASNRPITVEESLAKAATWPNAWKITAADIQAGEGIVASLVPFIRHLHSSGSSASTIRRHLTHLAMLGSELIRDRHMESPPAVVPPLADVVDEEGGPWLHRAEEDEQRAFDGTCRALHHFLMGNPKRRKHASRRKLSSQADAARLDALIEEAITDAYNDSEQTGGFLACFEKIAVPFTTTILGVEVTVTGFDVTDDDALVALCRRGKAKQRIPVLDLRLPSPPPAGHDWIAAYRRWRKG
jgi:hypothetical protein